MQQQAPMDSPSRQWTTTLQIGQSAAAPPASSSRDYSESNAITVLGTLQLVAGFLAVAFQAAATGIESNTKDYSTKEFVGCGIWCGITFAISGSLGVLAGRKNKKGLIVSFLVLNIVISVMLWALVGLAAVNLAMLNFCPPHPTLMSYAQPSYEYYNNGSLVVSRVIYTTNYQSENIADKSCFNTVTVRAWKAMNILLVVTGIFEFCVSIASAAYCCKQLSSCCRDHPPVVILQQNNSASAGTSLNAASVQPVFVHQGLMVQAQVFGSPSSTSWPIDSQKELPLNLFHPAIVGEVKPPGYTIEFLLPVDNIPMAKATDNDERYFSENLSVATPSC